MKVIQTPSLPDAIRRAAIETLALLPDPSAQQQLTKLLDQSNMPPALQAELLFGLGYHVDPISDARFAKALQSPSDEIKIIALELFAQQQKGPLPVEVSELLRTPNSRIRVAALKTIKACKDRQARNSVQQATHDADLMVRLIAIETLGELGGTEAREYLARIFAQGDPRMRQAVVGAIVMAGDPEVILTAAEDPAWRIRREAAVYLAHLKSKQSNYSVTVTKLLDDTSVDVQLETINAITNWPLETCGPFLLKAAGSENYRLRTAAVKALSTIWPTAQKYRVEQFELRRQETLATLQQAWREEFGEPTESYSSAKQPLSPQQENSDLTLRKVQQLVDDYRRGKTTAQRRQAVQELVKFEDKLLPTLQQLWSEHNLHIPEEFYEEVLPQTSPDFKHLKALRDSDSMVRSRAAEELARLATARGLLPLTLHRLAEIALKEQDPSVWRHLLDCIVGEGITGPSGTAAQSLAYAALWHRSPEVRRRACPFFAANGSNKHLQALLPLLQDDSNEVVSAAIKAISFCGPLEDPKPLLKLLFDTDKSLRVEAAAALTRLGYADGGAALERLSYDFDPAVRRLTAAAIGQLADPLLLSLLMRLLEDRGPVRSAALAALPNLVGEDITSKRTPPIIDENEKVELWKQWYLNGGEEQGTKSAKAGNKQPR